MRHFLPLSQQVCNVSLRLLQSTRLFLCQAGQARDFVISLDDGLVTSRQPKFTTDAIQLLLELRNRPRAAWSDVN